MAGSIIAGRPLARRIGVFPSIFGVLLVLLMPGGIPGYWARACDEGGASARAACYELSIAPENATQKVNASTSVKSATYPFKIKNTGDTALPCCDLVLFPWNFPPEEWSYNFVPSMPSEIDPNDPPKSFLLVIYPPADAEAKRYTFQLQGKSGVSSNSIAINLDVLQYGNVLVKAPAPQSADPGGTFEFVFELSNTGNGKDRFQITSVETSAPAISAHLKDGDSWTGQVGYRQSANKTVVVVLPAGMPTTEGTAGFQLSLLARSEFSPSQDDVNWSSIQVNHIYDLSLGASPPSARLMPGELGEFNVTVLNLGNGNDRITLNVTTSFDSRSWTILLGKSWFNIPAPGNDMTKLKVTPPPNALQGSDYRINLTAVSSGPAGAPIERNLSLDITILPARGLFAPMLDFVAPEPIDRGESVRFAFNFTNIGNIAETVDVTVVDRPLNWTAVLDVPSDIPMPPQATREANLTVQTSADRDYSAAGKYHVKLRVANADRSAALDFSFGMTIRPFYDWDLTVVGPKDVLLYPYIDSVHIFTMNVTNVGDGGDEIRLTVGGDLARWGALDSGVLPVGIGENRTVNLTVRVPDGTEAGKEYGLNVTAASKNRPGLVKTVDFSVMVVVMDLRVKAGSLLFAPREPEVGTTVKLRATVENLGTQAALDVGVAFFGPDRELIEIRYLPSIAPRDGSAGIEFTWEGFSEGDNDITVMVDPDDRIPESDEDNNRMCGVLVGLWSDLVIDNALLFRKDGRTVDRVPPGSEVVVTVTVRNLGNHSLNLLSVPVLLRDSFTGEEKMFLIEELPARNSLNVSFNLENLKPGTHLISVKVNPGGALREKTQNNNEMSGSLKVYEGGPRDVEDPWAPARVAVVAVILVAALIVIIVKRRRA